MGLSLSVDIDRFWVQQNPRWGTNPTSEGLMCLSFFSPSSQELWVYSEMKRSTSSWFFLFLSFQVQRLLSFSSLKSVIFIKPILGEWAGAWLSSFQTVQSPSFLHLAKVPGVAVRALPLPSWPHWARHCYLSCRKFPQTSTLLFVRLHNKSNRWLHLFLTGPIFWPLIMFVA